MEDPLVDLTIKELRAIARQYNVKGRSKPKTKSDLVDFLRKNLTADQIKKSVGGKKPTAKTRKGKTSTEISDMELADMPADVIWEIMYKLLPRDVLHFCATQQGASEICQSDMFWKQKIQRDFEGVYETSSIPVGTRFETYKEYWNNAQERFFPCVYEEHLQCIQSLLRLGIDPNRRDDDEVEMTALTFASAVNRLDIVQVLLDHGADPNIPAGGGTPALTFASVGHKDIIQLLLDYGADPTIVDRQGRTALFIAIIHRKVATLQLLLDRGVDPKIPNNDGETTLMEASLLGETDIVRILLEHGVDPNIQGVVRRTSRETALMEASIKGHADIVELLLEYDADPSIPDVSGNTPLEAATHYGHTDVIRLLS
uniref:Ankyrin repeat protein n=1 Tax=Pithovirus LCPAC304 TaxID=2506594 RepID=A0A481Z8A1_9VIRU|nr:MAG: ankyrin repeat protein [Pithovirus LCPAC304]